MKYCNDQSNDKINTEFKLESWFLLIFIIFAQPELSQNISC